MRDVLVVPQRAGMALGHARLADDFDLAFGRAAARRHEVRRRRLHVVLRRRLHLLRHIGRRQHPQPQPAAVVQRPGRIFVGDEDPDVLPAGFELDALDCPGSVRQIHVLDLLALDENGDGLRLPRAVIVQPHDLEGLDVHGDQEPDIHAAALERAALSKIVPPFQNLSRTSALSGGQSLLKYAPAAPGRGAELQQRGVIEPGRIRLIGGRRLLRRSQRGTALVAAFWAVATAVRPATARTATSCRIPLLLL